MSIDENKEESRPGSNAENTGGQGPKGTTQPATSDTKQDVNRIGTKEDIREVSGEEGDSTPEPRDNLRDGT